MSQSIKKTILLVCEGGGTESSYFESIKDILIERNVDIKLTISPIPKNEHVQEFKLREGAKKRQLKQLDNQKEIVLKKYEVEEDYKAQPICYVREAQMGLENGAFDEVWAVFDKDGHPKQKEAFELAEKIVFNKTVNIAFTSIAFEHWILLHYQQNDTAFVKSQCRDGNEKFNCGSNSHQKDCKGNSCVCGYLTTLNVFDGNVNKKKFLFNKLPNHIDAIQNAIWLKNIIEGRNPNANIYDLNPYTTIYRLIFRLINLPVDYIWFDRTKEVLTKNISFRLQREQSILRITIKNIQEVKFILNEGSFSLVNAACESISIGKRSVIDTEEISIIYDLNSSPDFHAHFIAYAFGETKFLITDI
jgi:hypothetical protein